MASKYRFRNIVQKQRAESANLPNWGVQHFPKNDNPSVSPPRPRTRERTKGKRFLFACKKADVSSRDDDEVSFPISESYFTVTPFVSPALTLLFVCILANLVL